MPMGGDGSELDCSIVEEGEIEIYCYLHPFI